MASGEGCLKFGTAAPGLFVDGDAVERVAGEVLVLTGTSKVAADCDAVR